MLMKNGEKQVLEALNPTGREGWPWTEACSADLYAGQQWLAISVVVATLKQKAFLEKTIRSVLMQNYPNLELIVIDGDSTDRSVEIIRKYADHLDFWVSEKDRGQADAINKGLSRASGDILYWINSDDYLLPQALYHIGAFDWQPDTGAVVGIGHKVDLHDRIQYTPEVPELNYHTFLNWVGYGNFMQPACFFSARAWQECGPLNENLHYCLDVDLWLKISQKYTFAKLEQALAHAYIHPDAKTTAEFDKMKIETALLVSQYGGFDIARKNMYQLWDEYHYAHKLTKAARRSVYFPFIRKLFKLLKG